MSFPDFFADARRITMRDPLADFLGAADDGLIEYAYADAVKLAGHSCPTVASAWMLNWHALRSLFPEGIAERGAIRVTLRGPLDEGVNGVVASIATLVTGAAQEGGFKGLAGRYARRGLLGFGADQPLALRFARVDGEASIDVQADLSAVPGDPEMPELLARSLANPHDRALARRFGAMWQERVRRILIDHADDPAVFRIEPVR